MAVPRREGGFRLPPPTMEFATHRTLNPQSAEPITCCCFHPTRPHLYLATGARILVRTSSVYFYRTVAALDAAGRALGTLRPVASAGGTPRRTGVSRHPSVEQHHRRRSLPRRCVVRRRGRTSWALAVRGTPLNPSGAKLIEVADGGRRR